jgi:hypothetical protein
VEVAYLQAINHAENKRKRVLQSAHFLVALDSHRVDERSENKRSFVKF